jgi:hypothetical protein
VISVTVTIITIIIIIIVNIWGFERILHGCGKGGYRHKHFIRGEECLCRHMERQKIKGEGQANNPSTAATATATATAVICSPKNNDTTNGTTTNDSPVLSPCDKSCGGDSPRRVSTQQHQQNCSKDTAPPGIPMLPLLCLDFDTIMDIPSPTPIISSSPKSNYNNNDNNADGYSSTALFNGNNNVCGGGGGTSPRSVTAFPPIINIESCGKTIITSEVEPIFEQLYSPPRPAMKYYGNNSNNNNSNSNSKINTFIIDDEMIDDMLTNSYQQEDNSDDGGFFEGRHFFFLDEHVTSSFPKRRVNRVSLSS